MYDRENWQETITRIKYNLSLLLFLNNLQVILSEDDRSLTLQESSSGIDFSQDSYLEGFELEFSIGIPPRNFTRASFLLELRY